jgi:predicted nucleotidyltransferase
MELVELKLKYPTKEIKCKPMIYTKQDRDEFAEDIKQMCEKGLIRPSKSKHSAPTFYVENHNEIKKRKKKNGY